MACKCSARMRKYVLPYFGFTLKEDEKIWVNPDFPDESLRVIKEADVDSHHAKLTAMIALRFGSSKFIEWAHATGWNITSEDVVRLLGGLTNRSNCGIFRYVLEGVTMIRSFKLWVDDVRTPRDYFDDSSGWYWCKDFNEAVKFCDTVSLARIEIISLDHDLGDGNSGYDFMRWLETEVRVWEQPLPKIICHSANPVGKANIERAVESIKRFLEERK